MNQTHGTLREVCPMGLREFPDKIEGYLGCDQNTAVVA
jgi:hypothetical protein